MPIKKIFKIIIPFLIIIGIWFAYQEFYKPEPLYLEMTMCSENGEVVQVVVDTKWYHKIGDPKLLKGDIYIDHTIFSYLPWTLPDGWKEFAVNGRYIPEFLPPTVTSRDNKIWNDYISSFRILNLGDATYYYINRYCSTDGKFSEKNNISYLGPACSKEEYNEIYRRWSEENN